MEDNEDVKAEADITQIESLVSDNAALEDAIRGYMADRAALTKRLTNLNLKYTEHGSVLEETRKDIATIDQKVFDLIGRLPEITTDNDG